MTSFTAQPPLDPDAPWTMRLGHYLQYGETDEARAEREAGGGWAVKLGNYLQANKPGPWSLVANKKPDDPLALRLGTFLNETKPIKALHGGELR